MVKLNLSDEVLTEIGKITVVFSLIEHSLGEIIGKIVTVGGRPRQLGKIVTAELSFRQLVSTLDSLLFFALGKDNECVAQFARVKPLLSQAAQERNVVVHSVWAKQSESADPHLTIRMKTTARQKKGLGEDWVSMDLEGIRRISDVVGNAWAKLCIFELHFQEPEDVESPSSDETGNESANE